MARTKNNGDGEQSTSSGKSREFRSTTSPFTRAKKNLANLESTSPQKKNLASPECISPTSSHSDDAEFDSKSKGKRGRATRRPPPLILDEAGKGDEDNDTGKKSGDNLKAGTSSNSGELKNGEKDTEVSKKDGMVNVCKLNMNGSTSAEDVTDGIACADLNGKFNGGEHVLFGAEVQNGTVGKGDLTGTDVEENVLASTVNATTASKAECSGNKQAEKLENEATKKDKNQDLENEATTKDENQDEVESVDEIGLVLPEMSFEESVSNGKKRKFYIEEMTDEDLLPRKKIKENDSKKRWCSIM